MDLRRLRAGEWMAGVGGAVLALALFLPWWGLRGAWIDLGVGGPVDGPGGGPDVVTTWSAWQVFSVADVLLLLLALGAMATWWIVATRPVPGPGLIAEGLLTPYAFVMLVVVVVQVLGTPGDLEAPPPIPDPSLEIGAWLGLAATVAIFAGLAVGMRDERLSRPGQPTDQTGVPVAEPRPVETLPGPPAA
ncbi:MAG: hypothetical protein GXY03_11310 [Solirubrobacterales bacterium]|nr:hypothetical protein [Solirubrobacterales bacterium]